MDYESTLLNSIMSIPTTIIYAVDKNYCYTKFSNQYKETIKRDFKIEPKIGMNIIDVVSDSSHKIKLQNNIDKALDKEHHTDYEVDGSRVVEIKYSPIIDGDKSVIGVVVIKNEIIKNYRKWFNNFSDLNIFESMTNFIKAGIVLVDPNQDDMPIVFVNDAFSYTTGYSKDEVVGKNCRFLQGDCHDQKPREDIKRALKEERSCEIEIKNFTKSGIPFYNLLHINPLFDDQGKLLYYIGLQLDITNSVEYRKINTIKKLSRGLTHEINTAMAPIKGHMEMLKYDIEAISDESTKKYMLDSLFSIQRSEKIIQDITNSLHYVSCTNKEENQKINILETINESIFEYKAKIKRNNIKIDFNICDESLTISAEKAAITHLWLILLDNAIDALVEIEKNRVLNISINQRENYIDITFEDNAKGISPEIQENIFKALTNDKDYGGVGIGLFVAKAIVENNNGTISFSTSSRP